MNIGLKNIIICLLAVLAVGLVFIEPAFAGADTTFGSTTTGAVGPVVTISNWLNGSLGILISIIALAVAVIAAIGGKLTGVISAVGVAIAIQVGPGVLANMFNATLPLVL